MPALPVLMLLLLLMMLMMMMMMVMMIMMLCRGHAPAWADCELWQDLDHAVVQKEGDVILAAMFPIHSKGVEQDLEFTGAPEARRCRGLNLRALRWSQALIFFIEEINRNPELLPNVTLGYRIYDTCWAVELSARAALSVVSQPPKRNATGACSTPSIPIVIGDSGSSLSIAVSRILNLFEMPLISYFSSCGCLSDRRQFPYFFRTIPSDAHQAGAMALLVQNLGWSWVGALGADDAYGRAGIEAFVTAATRLGVCVAFRVTVPKAPRQGQIRDMVRTIRDSEARVLVTFATEEDMEPLLEEVVRQEVTGRLWVASEAWVTSPLIAARYPSLGGTLGFALRRAQIPGLREFLNDLKPFGVPYNPAGREFWETAFRCSFDTPVPVGSMAEGVRYNRTCSGAESVRDTESTYNDVSQLRVTYNLHKAVYAAAHALNDLLKCPEHTGHTCPDIYHLQPGQVRTYLRDVNYTNEFGDTVTFDEFGDPAGSYDIVNWQLEGGGMRFITVGRFDSSLPPQQQLTLQQDLITWPGGSRQVPVSRCSARCVPGYRKASRKGEPACCYDCVPCAEGSISDSADQSECALCPEDLWSNPRRDRCVDKQVEFLSHSEGFGVALACTAAVGVASTVGVALVFLRHRETPLVRAHNSQLSFLLLASLCLCFLCAPAFLGRPGRWACPLRRMAFALAFALCLSCVLSKTLVVLVAFRATMPGRGWAQRFRGPQQRLGVLACWAVQGAVCATWLATRPPHPVKNTWLYRDRVILECHPGSVPLFCCVLGYIGLLAAVCFILAFLARKLPDHFNEAKFITFSMLIFCVVWIAFVPAYVSSPGKYTVAVEIFAILASSYGLLFCIFAPKCYIIIFTPEKNTKKFLMGQRGGR